MARNTTAEQRSIARTLAAQKGTQYKSELRNFQRYQTTATQTRTAKETSRAAIIKAAAGRSPNVIERLLGIKRETVTGGGRSTAPATRPDSSGDTTVRTVGLVRLQNDLPGKHRSFEAGKTTSLSDAKELAASIAKGTSPFPWASARAVKIEVKFHPKGSSRFVKGTRKKGEKKARKQRVTAEDDFYTVVVTGPLDAATDSEMTSEVVFSNLGIDYMEDEE